eukprot:scaffold201_cov48-Cyclotella_meneghiniana.AAC.6
MTAWDGGGTQQPTRTRWAGEEGSPTYRLSPDFNIGIIQEVCPPPWQTFNLPVEMYQSLPKRAGKEPLERSSRKLFRKVCLSGRCIAITTTVTSVTDLRWYSNTSHKFTKAPTAYAQLHLETTHILFNNIRRLQKIVGAAVLAFLADFDAFDGRGVTTTVLVRDGAAVGSLGSSISKGDAVGAEETGGEVGPALGETDGDALGDADGDAEGDVLGLALGEADGDALGEADGDAEGDMLGLALGEADGDALGDANGDAEGDVLGLALGEADGDALGDADALGEVVGLVGLKDGLSEGEPVGFAVP